LDTKKVINFIKRCVFYVYPVVLVGVTHLSLSYSFPDIYGSKKPGNTVDMIAMDLYS